MSKKVVLELEKVKDGRKAEVAQRFFKTKKGEYGYGDIFWGVDMPKIRDISKRYYREISFSEIKELISSPIHEIRLTGYIILTYRYESGSKNEREEVLNFYLNNLKGVNNWDIVDASCYKILGNGIYEGIVGKEVLYDLARSRSMWKKRISIVSTYSLLKRGIYEDTLNISEILLQDGSDLIQKAVGWMLREVGQRDIQILRKFLDINMKDMSRITLRYSIEGMEEKERTGYLKSSLR